MRQFAAIVMLTFIGGLMVIVTMAHIFGLVN